jgi:NADH-quinone oxidoreductase subunit M
LVYAELAFISLLWWHFSDTGSFGAEAIAYGAAVILLIAALLFAWQRAQRQCGDLTLDRMHGLARPMPRLAIVVSLLVMAAAGLPPFGLFASFTVLLLQPAGGMSWDLIAILIAWFLASWYLFRMMQRLLFGPHRTDLRYEDLRGGEFAGFALIILVLALLGAASFAASQPGDLFNSKHIALEKMPWRR